MTPFRVMLLPGSVLPGDLAYGSLVAVLGSVSEAVVKERASACRSRSHVFRRKRRKGRRPPSAGRLRPSARRAHSRGPALLTVEIELALALGLAASVGLNSAAPIAGAASAVFAMAATSFHAVLLARSRSTRCRCFG